MIAAQALTLDSAGPALFLNSMPASAHAAFHSNKCVLKTSILSLTITDCS